MGESRGSGGDKTAVTRLRSLWGIIAATDFFSRRTHMTALQAGTQAPEFSLASHDGKTLALSSFRGRRTVVSFLPFAFTGGWKNQVSGFRANLEQFKNLDVEILQISADTIPSLKAWAEQLGGIPFPLLSDYWPHGAVGNAYGVFNDERGMDARSAFLVDAQGVIRYSHVYAQGTIPESADLLERLKKI
jgi:mycoredoxin-dependent peroxiredoxin